MKMKRFLIAALALALLIALAPSLPLHTASAATVVTGVTITGRVTLLEEGTAEIEL